MPDPAMLDYFYGDEAEQYIFYRIPKNSIRKPEIQTSEKQKSKVPQTGSQSFQKTATNNTEKNKTEFNDTDLSIYPARGLTESRGPWADNMVDRIRAYRRLIKENIEYDITRERLGYDAPTTISSYYTALVNHEPLRRRVTAFFLPIPALPGKGVFHEKTIRLHYLCLEGR